MNLSGALTILPLRCGMMLLGVSSIVNYGVCNTTTSSLETFEDVLLLESNISSRATLLFGLKLFT
jgi:hypothetical protein